MFEGGGGGGGGGGEDSVNQGACIRPLQMFGHASMEAMHWADQSTIGDHGKSKNKASKRCEDIMGAYIRLYNQ